MKQITESYPMLGKFDLIAVIPLCAAALITIVACVITVVPGPDPSTTTTTTTTSGTESGTEDETEGTDVNTASGFGETGTAEGDEGDEGFTSALLDIGLESIGTDTMTGPDTGAEMLDY